MATGSGQLFGERVAEMRERMATGDRAAVEIAMVIGDELVADPLFGTRPARERTEVLDVLGMAYYERHLGLGARTDLERALALYRQAVAGPSGDVRRDQQVLNNLVICLSRRFQLVRDDADAAEMLATTRRLVDATPADSPLLGGRLSNLGVALGFHAGEGSDEVVDVYRRAVAVTDPDDPDVAMYQYNLGSTLLRRYELAGDPQDLEEAVVTLEAALAGSDPDSAAIPARYANLARAYWTSGSATEQEVAVDLIESAVRDLAIDVPERRMWSAWRDRWLAELADGQPQTVADVLGDRPADDVVELLAVCSCLGAGLPLEALGDLANEDRLARAEQWLAADDDGVAIDHAVRRLLGITGIGERAAGRAVAILRRRFAPELDGEPDSGADADYFEIADRWQELVVRVARVGGLSVRFGIDAVGVVELVEQVAELAHGYGDLAPALALYELALPLRTRIHGPEHSKVAGVRLEYGTALWRSGAQDAARGHVAAALETFERVLGADHPRTATALMQLASILQRVGEAEAALPLMRRAVDSFRAHVGPLNPELGSPLQNLGTLLRDLGRRDEAVPQFELAVALCRLGPPSMTGAIALDNLGTTLYQDGELGVARACFESVLREYESVRPTASDVSVTRYNLGRVLARLGERDAALEQFEAAIELAGQAGLDPELVQSLALERAAIERADPAGDPPPTAPVGYEPRSPAARLVQVIGDAMRCDTAADVRRFGVQHPEVTADDALTQLAEQGRAFRRAGRHDAADEFDVLVALLAEARDDGVTATPVEDRPTATAVATEAVRSEFRAATAALNRYRDGGDPADLRLGIGKLQLIVDAGRPAAPPAAVVNNLGWAHSRLLGHGDDEAAGFLAMCEEPTFRSQWTEAERAVVDLAEAAFRRRRWNLRYDPADLDTAIRLYDRGLSTADLPRADRVRALSDQASSFGERLDAVGDPADLDRLITAAQGALELAVDTDRDFAHAVLAEGLLRRFEMRGDGADLEHSVRILRRAAAAQVPGAGETLTNALTDLFMLNRDPALIEEACRLARDADARAVDPADRARTANNLAVALVSRFELTEEADDIVEAVDCMRRALGLVGPDAPVRRLYLENIGGYLCMAVSAGHMPEAIDDAVDACRTAAELGNTPAARTNLGIALGTRHGDRGGDADLAEARTMFRDVCREGLARGGRHHLNAAIAWHTWAFDRDAWAEVVEAVDYGLTMLGRLVTDQYTASYKLGWLRVTEGMAGRGAYATAKLGRPADAAAVLERGRTLLLQEALGRDPRARAGLAAAGQTDLARRYAAALAEVESLERHADRTTTPDGFDRLRVARATFAGVAAELEAVPGFERLGRPLTAADLRAAAVPMPLVYLASTTDGGLAITVPAEGPIHCDWLPEARAGATLRHASDWLRADEADLGARIDETMRWLWDAVAAPVLHRVGAFGGATVIASGPLSLLPLHAAWRPEVTAPSGRRYALDDALITYAPSASAYRVSRERAAGLSADSVLVVAPDDRGDLPYTREEAELVHRIRPAGRVLVGASADRPAVEAALSDHQVLHFACHGRYAPFAPLDSGLVLAGSEVLTLGRLLALRLPEVRLTVLSACETALPSLDVVDEALGLPVGLLIAGAAGVVGTGWRVPDLGAMLVMARFYATWLGGGPAADAEVSPPAALRAAQQWVRDSTNGELRAAFPQLYATLSLPPAAEAFWATARPFSAPLYWASFAYIGF